MVVFSFKEASHAFGRRGLSNSGPTNATVLMAPKRESTLRTRLKCPGMRQFLLLARLAAIAVVIAGRGPNDDRPADIEGHTSFATFTASLCPNYFLASPAGGHGACTAGERGGGNCSR